MARRGRPPHPDLLTPAARRVLEGLRQARANAEIALQLGVSPDALKYHVSNMLAKRDLRDRRVLPAWRPPAADRGLQGLLKPLRGVALVVTAVAVLLAVGSRLALLRGGDEALPVGAGAEAEASEVVAPGRSSPCGPRASRSSERRSPGTRRPLRNRRRRHGPRAPHPPPRDRQGPARGVPGRRVVGFLRGARGCRARRAGRGARGVGVAAAHCSLAAWVRGPSRRTSMAAASRSSRSAGPCGPPMARRSPSCPRSIASSARSTWPARMA